MRRLGSALLLAAATGAAGAGPRDEAALRACLKANAPQHTMEQDVTLTRTDPGGGTQKLVASWFWRRRDEGPTFDATLRLTAPPDLAGSSYLFNSEDGKAQIRLYLPSLRQVRRVSGAGVAQSLFGTGLSAFDIKFLTDGLRGGQLTRIGTTAIAGREAETWRYIPPSDPEILYDRIDVSIDAQSCLPLSASMFGGVPWKTLTVAPADIAPSGSRWIVRRATLQDLRDGSRTVIQVDRQQFDEAISDRVFSARTFYEAAPR